MYKYIDIKYFFNILLFFWVIFIPFKNAFYQASTVVIGLFFVIYLIVKKDFVYLKELLFLYKDLVVIFILIIISMTMSNLLNDVSSTKAWRLEINYIYRYAFIFLSLVYFYSKNFFSRKILVIFILVSLSIQALDGVYQSIMLVDFFKEKQGSIFIGLTGATFQKNAFGLIVGVGTLLIFLLIDKKKSFYVNIFYSLLFLIFLFCTLFSHSRAVWVALSVVFILYILFNVKKIRLVHLLSFIIFLTILSIMFYNIEPLYTRIELVLNGHYAYRFQLWEHSLNLFNQKPFFGWGLDIWKIYGMKDHSGTHNVTLEILIYVGSIGLFIYFVFLVLTLKEIYVNKDFNILLIWVYFVIDSQFDQSIFSGKIFLSSLVLLLFYTYIGRIDKECDIDMNKLNNKFAKIKV